METWARLALGATKNVTGVVGYGAQLFFVGDYSQTAVSTRNSGGVHCSGLVCRVGSGLSERLERCRICRLTSLGLHAA